MVDKWVSAGRVLQHGELDAKLLGSVELDSLCQRAPRRRQRQSGRQWSCLQGRCNSAKVSACPNKLAGDYFLLECHVRRQLDRLKVHLMVEVEGLMYQLALKLTHQPLRCRMLRQCLGKLIFV